MFEPQHFLDLQDNSTSFGDPKSWLIGDDNSSPSQHRTQPSLGTANSNVDRVLFKDLVEIVPLVQSLIDRKANSSFTRRGSVYYTKTPSRESLSKKVDPKGRNVAQSLPPKKKKDHGDKELGKNANSNQDADSFSIFSSRALGSEKENKELVALREEVEDLRRKLLEKDELLKSAESSISEMNAVHVKLDELKLQVAEKDSLVKSTQLQLSDAKIKLADKQAMLERIQWEAMMANKKVEKLQEELDSMQGEITSIMQLFKGIIKKDSTIDADDDYDVAPYYRDRLSDTDDVDDTETQKIEEAREAYIAAVAAAKNKQDEESIAAAASARLYLQSIVFKSNNFSIFRTSEAPSKAFAC
ncbi:protein MICROTUBULE BINDING PROTEIN 2C-like [Mangifera indica]|uniref:protein MICROTUBULE BINDING PROTEIN 2C-like n=1 Tax=Mangifera indica TaxID=29780 RepID=UPI001CF9B66F|nr:protein MICROTUBULE BINDING PROTEIN 2C-like [Mangifera indica]